MDKFSEFEENISITESITIENRTYFSLTHIRSAVNTANLCTQIEDNYKNTSVPNEEITNYQGYAASALMSSVAFLEALINEFFRDVNDNFHNVKTLEKQVLEIIKFYWNMEKPSLERDFSILDKYNLALQLAQKEPFQKGSSPYQDIKSLIDLRNSLTHYKLFPHVSIDEEPSLPSKIESSLKGKFELSPYQTGFANPFFPDKCISRGCAIWAIESSLRFAEDFFDKMGLTLPPEYLDIYSRIKRLS